MEKCFVPFILHQHEDPLNSCVVLVSNDYNNEQKDKISDPEGIFYLHSKDAMLHGAMQFLSEKSY